MLASGNGKFCLCIKCCITHNDFSVRTTTSPVRNVFILLSITFLYLNRTSPSWRSIERYQQASGRTWCSKDPQFPAPTSSNHPDVLLDVLGRIARPSSINTSLIPLSFFDSHHKAKAFTFQCYLCYIRLATFLACYVFFVSSSTTRFYLPTVCKIAKFSRPHLYL